MRASGGLPLAGISVVELASQAPAPLATRILEDFGAEVTLVEAPGGRNATWASPEPLLLGGKGRVVCDLKTDHGVQAVRDLAAGADVFVEAFRPGVAERLGVGPERLCADNPRLVYLRVTGWGQGGPREHEPGHEINYLALAGALRVSGGAHPTSPPTLVGDFAAGSLVAVIGVLLALEARRRDGMGQVVDSAIVDGVLTLMSGLVEMEARQPGAASGTSPISGAAPFYRTYECRDGRWFAVGAIESGFYRNMLDVLGLEDVPTAEQYDVERWPALSERVANIFASLTRDEWARRFEGADACGTPVLDIGEVGRDPHLLARRAIAVTEGGWMPTPAPRLGRTPGRRRHQDQPGAPDRRTSGEKHG